MRVLPSVTPTPEQLQILEADTYSTVIIRGSAGSGKTTAAALRCRKVLAGIAADRELDNDKTPIRVAVLTFNRTLAGYIENFIDEQVDQVRFPIDYTIDTFANWAFSLTGRADVIDDHVRLSEISKMWSRAPVKTKLTGKFIADEVDYVLGRFGRDGLGDYLECERVGRGKPTLGETRRESIIEYVVKPYLTLLEERGLIDWNDCALRVLAEGDVEEFDVIVADEVQDFTVQQVRAILARLKADSSLTIVIDAAQSIYPKHIDWPEIGIDIASEADCYTLHNNYRNSPQIAQFVQPLLTGIRLSDDGTLPDYHNCRGNTRGRTPTLYAGKFTEQLAYAIAVIQQEVDLSTETVGILTHGGDGPGEITKTLTKAKLKHCNLQKEKVWPKGPANIGISTLHSAKGLEFDHVFILGFDTGHVGFYDDDIDDYQQRHLRMLLAMAITRAKRTVVIGYRKQLKSGLLKLFDRNTYLSEPQ